MWAQVLMAVIGLSAGMVVAGGLVTFISELGVVSDFCENNFVVSTSLLNAMIENAAPMKLMITTAVSFV